MAVDALNSILSALRGSMPIAECPSCECLLGFVTQLEIDGADPAALDSFRVPPEQQHACLGCDPCPPADHFAAYLGGKGCARDSCC